MLSRNCKAINMKSIFLASKKLLNIFQGREEYELNMSINPLLLQQGHYVIDKV